MKILVSESTSAMGGQELAVLLHADRLRQRGHDVRLLLEPGSPICEKALRQGLAVDPVPMSKRRYSSAILAFRRILRRERPDVLHMNSSRDSWIGTLAARSAAPRPALVRTRHISTPLNRNLATRLLYRRLFDMVIVTGGERTRRGLIERDGLPPERVAAFPIGVDLDEYRPGAPDHDLRAELGVPRDQSLVGLISYLRAYKGHEYFIEAAALLRQRAKDVTFLIVGEGPEEGALRARIAARGLTESVRMLGFRKDLLTVFRSLDLFVMPSVEADTIPQVLMQALAMELPVIATSVGSIADVIREGVTGFVVPPRDAAALAMRIEALLNDPSLRRTLGRNGRNLVRESYSLDAMVDQLEAVYRQALKAIA
jgi:glycosyltransferase involved in cell wall biosynthesis